jgi:hypothetical protein
VLAREGVTEETAPLIRRMFADGIRGFAFGTVCRP